MGNESSDSRTYFDTSLNHPRESQSTFNGVQKSFLNFNPNSELSFHDKSAIYCSLVTLVKEDYPFDTVLQVRAAQFLKNLEPKFLQRDQANKLITDLVPSSTGSTSGFVESIATLLSSPHSTVVEAAFFFLKKTTEESSPSIQCRLVESDLVTHLFAILQPHTLPISGHETRFDNLIRLTNTYVTLAHDWSLRELGLTAAIDQFNHREMIFQKVMNPSSPFILFLISNRHLLNQELLKSFIFLLEKLLGICPFHRPTLEFVLTSPIVMTFTSCLSFAEDNFVNFHLLNKINYSLRDWKRGSAEMAQCGKRITKALFSEGFENTLGQMILYNQNGDHCGDLVHDCHQLARLLGSNVKEL